MAELRSLAGPQCEALIGVFAEAGEISATVVDGSQYGSWHSHDGELMHAAFGLEPRGAAFVSAAEADPVLADLLELWRSPLCVARGPIGLDYTVGGEEEWAAQRRLLARLLSLAGHVEAPEASSKPLILCCRGGEAAERDAAELICEALRAAQHAAAGEMRAPSALPTICCLDAGLLWTRLFAARMRPLPFQVFDGSLTFAKAHQLHELAFDVPLDRILLASGAPRNLPTQACGGRRSVCHSGHITFVVERLCEIKRGSVDATDLLEAARANTRAVFGV